MKQTRPTFTTELHGGSVLAEVSQWHVANVNIMGDLKWEKTFGGQKQTGYTRQPSLVYTKPIRCPTDLSMSGHLRDCYLIRPVIHKQYFKKACMPGIVYLCCNLGTSK